jgi:hypothetical protein
MCHHLSFQHLTPCHFHRCFRLCRHCINYSSNISPKSCSAVCSKTGAFKELSQTFAHALQVLASLFPIAPPLNTTRRARSLGCWLVFGWKLEERVDWCTLNHLSLAISFSKRIWSIVRSKSASGQWQLRVPWWIVWVWMLMFDSCERLELGLG